MTTKIPAELSSTPGISDSSNATAITINSSENVTVANNFFIEPADSAKLYFTSSTGYSPRIEGDSTALTFKTNNTERMRLANDGKFGIGDTSPDAMLKVVSNSASVVGSWIRGDYYGLRVSGGSTSSHYALRVANSSDSSLMTVNGDGKVMIGGTSPSALFQVNGTVAFSHAYSANATALNITNTVGTNNYFAQAFYSSSSLAGYIFVASSTNTTQYATSGSDLSFKENIKDWDENVLDKFKNIKPVTFNFKSDETKEEIKGYIAQNEVDKFPEAYPKNPTDEKHWFNPSGMTVYLMKAIKEQQDIIEDLKSRIETLEG